jgi:hypothetical protein
MKLRDRVVRVSKLFRCTFQYVLSDCTLIGCPNQKSGRGVGGATGKDMAAGLISLRLR